MVTGVALRWSAIHALGPWFRSSVALTPGQPRIRRGPYRWLRHPSEIGLLSAVAGAALALGSPLALLLEVGLLLPLSWLRARREDRALDGRA